MLKKNCMLVMAFLFFMPPAVYAGELEGAWRLTGYEVQNTEVPVSGVILFADGYFTMVYEMRNGELSARGHGGKYTVSGDEITYTIPWWVEQMAGESRVFEDEVVAKAQIDQLGEQLVIRFASGSVQKFEKLESESSGDLAGVWLMDSYEGRAKTGSTSGLAMFAGKNFALIYTMDSEGVKDGRAHAGTFQRSSQEMTLFVAWSLEVVGGDGSVAESSSSRQTNVTVDGDSLTLELGGGSVQKFHRPEKEVMSQ